MNTPNTVDYKYNVAVEPLFTREGTESGVFATVRQDNRKVLGAVSNRYGIVQNDDLVESIKQGIQGLSLEATKSEAYVEKGGARFFARYDFKNTAIVPNVGDVVGLRITARNSFDKSSSITFALGFLRLVCKNGLTRSGNELAISQTHVGIGDLLKDIKSGLVATIGRFESAVLGFGQLAEIQIQNQHGHGLINHLTRENIIPKRLAEAIHGVWERPTFDADKPRNLWSLYNAGTQVLTHEVEATRFETANKVNAKLSDAIFALANHPETIPTLALAS